jgi:hypothetical protein
VKNVKTKELREGVCESCVGKGVTAGAREVEDVWEIKGMKDGSVLASMTWSPARAEANGRRPSKK